MNLRPFDVTTVLLDAGQARLETPPEAVGAPLEVLAALELLEVLVPVGWTKSGLVKIVSRLPAPQY